MNLKQQLQTAFTEKARESLELGEHTVYINELPYGELKELGERAKGDQAGSDEDFGLLILARCMVDEDGQRVFEDDELDVMRAVPKRRFEKAVELATRVNGLTAEKDSEGN